MHLTVPRSAVEHQVHTVLNSATPFVTINTALRLSRVQGASHTEPIFYNALPKSVSRYAHRRRAAGVGYLACSDELAILEVFQHGRAGPGTAVLQSEIDGHVLLHAKACRDLTLMDVGELSRRMGLRPGQLIAPRGADGEGYRLPQAISTACCDYSPRIDGLLYMSSVYTPTAAPELGRNVVLFGGRGAQLTATRSTPLRQVLLPCGKTVYELLEDYQVDLEPG